MKHEKVITKSIEINWQKLGISATAYVGSTTALGENYVSKLYELITKEPRVVEAYNTIGAHQYLMRVLDIGLQELRDSVLTELEPLTADLTTSIVSSEVKKRDYASFLSFLRKSNFKAT